MRWRHAHHFIAALKRRGFEVIGEGSYSVVLAKPGADKVIKVNIKLDDWPKYILWAAQRGFLGNFAPSVTSFKVFESEAKHFYVAVMERLSNIHPEENPAASRSSRELSSAMGGAFGFAPAGAEKFVSLFREFSRGTVTDLHAGNFMLRRTGEVVATDPVTWAYRPELPGAMRRARLKDFSSWSNGEIGAPVPLRTVGELHNAA